MEDFKKQLIFPVLKQLDALLETCNNFVISLNSLEWMARRALLWAGGGRAPAQRHGAGGARGVAAAAAGRAGPTQQEAQL